MPKSQASFLQEIQLPIKEGYSICLKSTPMENIDNSPILSPAAMIVESMRVNGSLPAFDETVQEICLVTSQENSNIRDLSKVIMRDCGLATSVLDTINSAIYGLRMKILTISSAIRYLGFNKVKSLALGLTIMNSSLPKGSKNRLQKLYGEAFFCGFFSLALAQSYKHKHPEEAFVVGLLKGLPMLAMNYSFPMEMYKLPSPEEKPQEFEKEFRTTFDCSYQEICREVLKLYKISGDTANYILQHKLKDSMMNHIIRQSRELSSHIFSGSTPPAKLLTEVEEMLRVKTRNRQLSIFKYLKTVMLSDNNLKRFFHLDETDIQLLVKSFEESDEMPSDISFKISGHKTLMPKANPNRQTQKVISKEGQEETQKSITNPVLTQTVFDQFISKSGTGEIDRNALFGNYMTELMLFSKEKKSHDDLLELVHDALYHCLSEQDTYLLVIDKKNNKLQSKLYSGNSKEIQDDDLAIELNNKKSLLVKALITKQMVCWSDDGNHELCLTEKIAKITQYNQALIAPLLITKTVFGLFFSATEEEFSPRQELWFEQLIGQLNNTLSK